MGEIEVVRLNERCLGGKIVHLPPSPNSYEEDG